MFHFIVTMKKILPVLLVLAAAVGAYFYFNRQPAELVLTGLITTNDVIVGPQIGGRIERLLVNEGDTVTRGQLLAVIAPDELRAESAYATHNVEGLSSQIQEAQASVRYEELQTTEQISQAESNLAATEAQQASASADLESARLNYERTQNLSREGVAAAQQLDEARIDLDREQARARRHGPQQCAGGSPRPGAQLDHQRRVRDLGRAHDAALEEARARDDRAHLLRTLEEALQEGEAMIGLETDAGIRSHAHPFPLWAAAV